MDNDENNIFDKNQNIQNSIDLNTENNMNKDFQQNNIQETISSISNTDLKKSKKSLIIVLIVLSILIIGVVLFLYFNNKNNNQNIINSQGNSQKSESIQIDELLFTVELYDKKINFYESYAATIKDALKNFTLYYRLTSKAPEYDGNAFKDYTLTLDNVDEFLNHSYEACNIVYILTDGSNEINGDNNLISIEASSYTTSNDKNEKLLKNLKLESFKYPALNSVKNIPKIKINDFEVMSGVTTRNEIIEKLGDDYTKSSSGDMFTYRGYNDSNYNLHFHSMLNSNDIISSVNITRGL